MASKFWHPFADMRVVAHNELVLTRGEGSWVWDEAGRRYLDASASLWYCNIGHGRAEIAEAVADQIRKLEAYHTFGDFTTPPVIELTDRLAQIAPIQGSVSFLTSGGSDSVDTAIKLARLYHTVTGNPDRTFILSRSRAYHGMHTAGTSLAGIAPNHDGYGRLLTDTALVEWDSFNSLLDVIEGIGAERIAAFICEPIIGAGGIFPPPPGYLEKVRSICRDTGILFIADEVITGFGRTGSWFASGRWNLEPDLMTTAKGITSGYLPLGAVIAAPHIAEPWFEGEAPMWRHGYTYSGHTTAVAAANVNLDIIQRENLIAEADRLETELATELGPLADHDLVEEVRCGVGALTAVQLTAEASARNPNLPVLIGAMLRQHGILSRVLFGNSIQVSPPFVMTGEEVKELSDRLRAALDETSAHLAG
ncbi:MAG: aspartate aminotransferase family protein [Acidimicrobiia bacterium]|nr:aspartate aminotransferase family protein [Acidimicrobiia bacterium]